MSYERDDVEDWEWREHARRLRRARTCQCHGDMPGTCPGPAYCPMVGRDDDDDPEPDSNATLGLLNPMTAPRRVGY